MKTSSSKENTQKQTSLNPILTLKVVRTGSVGNSYVLECGEHSLILDCGVHHKEIQQAIDFNMVGVDAVLVTHVHGDHASGIKYWLTMGIPVFSCREVAEAYPGVEALRSKFVRRVGQKRWSVIPFIVPHDNTENYGFLIKCPNGEQVLYATDYAYIKDRFASYKVEHFLLECNYMDYKDVSGDSLKDEHVIHGHAPLSVVKGFLEANLTENTKNVILCHLSKENADPKEIMRVITEAMPERVNVTIAKRGLNITLTKGDPDDERRESAGDV